MKVLVIGGGGRDNAIAKQFKNSASVKNVCVAPGNDGLIEEAEVVGSEATAGGTLVELATEKEMD